MGAGHSDRSLVFRQLLQARRAFAGGFRFDFHLRHAGDDPRRAARPLPLLRSGGVPFEAVDHHHGVPRRRHGKPRRGRRPAHRVVALFAQEPAAVRLVARPHHDRRGHRRGGRADGQPFQFGDFRYGDRPAVGLRVRPFGQVGARVRPGGGASHADLRGAVLLGHIRHPLLALLRPRHGAPPSGGAVRHRPDRSVPDAFFHRVHQDRAGGVRTGMAARHGTVAEHSVHPAGSLYDLARNDAARRVRGRSGAEGGSGSGAASGNSHKKRKR